MSQATLKLPHVLIPIIVDIFSLAVPHIVSPLAFVELIAGVVGILSIAIFLIIEPFAGVLISVVVRVDSLSVSLPVPEFSLESVSIRIPKNSGSVELVVLEFSLILVAVVVVVGAKAIDFGVLVVSHELVSIGKDHRPYSLGLIILPKPFKVASALVLDETLSKLLVVFKVALVLVSIFEEELALSLLFSVDPASLILLASEEVVVYPLAMLLVIHPIAVIFVAIEIVVLPDSFLLPVLKTSLVPVSLLVDVDSVPMELVVFPIPQVHIPSLQQKDSFALLDVSIHFPDIFSSVWRLEGLHAWLQFLPFVEDELVEEALFDVFVGGEKLLFFLFDLLFQSDLTLHFKLEGIQLMNGLGI